VGGLAATADVHAAIANRIGVVPAALAMAVALAVGKNAVEVNASLERRRACRNRLTLRNESPCVE
jgi:hypothetical protein